MLSDNLVSLGALGVIWAAHSQKEAIKAARSADNLDSFRPDSMMGIRAAAARNRFSSGDGRGRDLGISLVYQSQIPSKLRFINSNIPHSDLTGAS